MFTCNVCGKNYKTSSGLKYHISTHQLIYKIVDILSRDEGLSRDELIKDILEEYPQGDVSLFNDQIDKMVSDGRIKEKDGFYYTWKYNPL